MTSTTTQTEAAVDLSSDTVRAQLVDRRADVIETFAALPADQQGDLAVEAWRIGIRALRIAYSQAEEARLGDIGKTLKEDLGSAMASAISQHHDRMTSELRRFLDPADGEFSRRLEQFISGDGELARRLSEFVSPEGSVLAETLARQVGAQSLLFQKLSPTDSEGLVQTLKAQLATVLAESQSTLATAMDPLNEESPIARFLFALRTELKTSETDRSGQMATALRALDGNDPNSLLSNLARKTQEASTAMLTAMNPADPSSPLRLLQNQLTTLLEAHTKSVAELNQASAARLTQLENVMREAVTRLEFQRSARLTTTKGGLQFEDLVTSMIQDYLRSAPVVCTRTGNVVGIRDRCKVGDLCVHFTEESKWFGSRIVFEIKQDASCQVIKAIQELDIARDNREADIGVFVLAETHTPTDFPPFSRHGHNILVTFDPEDPATYARLEAAVMLAAALASRAHAVADTSSLDAIKDFERVLTEQLSRIAKMRQASDAIRKHNDTLRKELQKAEDDLRELSENARGSIALLSAGEDEAAEREEPISFSRSPRTAPAA